MKKKILWGFIASGLLFPSALLAQDERIETGDGVVIIEEDSRPDTPWSRQDHNYSRKTRYGKIRAHWSGISFGYNGLVQNMGNLQLPGDARYMKQEGNSINFNLNFFDIEMISTRRFAFLTGIGMEFNTFRFRNNISLTQDASGYTVPDYSYAENGINLKKTKLSTNYFVMPLLAEFRFGRSPRHAFYVHGGVIGGWCYNAHTKVKYTSPLSGKTCRDKNHDLNVPRFRYGYTVGIGFSNVGLFARYYPRSIFVPGEGPNVKQVSIGISLNTAGR